MKLVKKVFIVFSIILLVITAIGYIFFRSHVHVERSIVINKPQAELFSVLNTHKNFNDWSPWFSRDTTMQIIFSGPESGTGAKFSWISSVKSVGTGSMEITSSKPDSVIRQVLTFMDKGNSNASYLLSEEGGGTRLVWTLDIEAGANPLLRIMGAFMDKVVGEDFEKGLAKLKAIVETQVDSIN